MNTTELTAAMAADRCLIDASLGNALRLPRSVPSRLAAAMRYAVLGPGKRIRPILALEAFRAGGGLREDEVIPFCCGIEMIHAFSLVHDDLPCMDDDDYRRGRPSLHRRFDQATAVLAADALFARAFELFAAAPADDRRKLQAIGVICRAVGPEGMTGGQMLDMTHGGGQGANRLARLHLKKTAEFMAAALVSGALVAGAGAGVRRSLWQAGISLGRLFQTTDDMLDQHQTSDRGRLTAPAVAGHRAAELRARRQAYAAGRRLRALGREYDLLAALPSFILNRAS